VKTPRAPLRKARRALVFASVLSLSACGGSSGSSSSQFMDGAEVENAVSGRLHDSQGETPPVQCPNQRLYVGDTMTCSATFSDGSFHDITATFKGNNVVKIDLP
jgi:Domain of unknown function (DUF4333)